jgi:hypothetical protein
MMELLHGSPKAARLRNGNRADRFCGCMANVCVLPTCYPTGVLIGVSRSFQSGIWQEHLLVSDPLKFLVRRIQTVNQL